MKKALRNITLVLVALAMTTVANAQSSSKDIVDTAVGADNFKTLVAAVKAAGLVEVLKGEGPFTVFAPTDEAFKKVPKETLMSLLKPENKEKLQSILKFHVVKGKVMAADVVKLSKTKTVQGQEVKVVVKDGVVRVNGAKVVKTDIACKNGVIHVIDGVIQPKDETSPASTGSASKSGSAKKGSAKKGSSNK